jgi:aminoglycoside 3-N-acetyltransferase
MTLLLPKLSKRVVKGWLKQIRLAYIRHCHSFNREDLIQFLRRLGVKQGDVLLVHSSFNRFDGFIGKPTDVILALEQVVGPSGTVLMPTLPFTGTAVDYAARSVIFDVTSTPSRMGLLTELFRRSPGVLRSVHPTHSVAAWGARAKEIIVDHHLAKTPCGVGSPFIRLLELDGRILFLGTGIGSMTFFHAVEELLASQMPFSPFTAETFTLQSRDVDGKILFSNLRLFDPTWSRRRNLEKLIPALKSQNAWANGRIGTLESILLEAKEVLQACRELAAKGVYCYDT